MFKLDIYCIDEHRDFIIRKIFLAEYNSRSNNAIQI